MTNEVAVQKVKPTAKNEVIEWLETLFIYLSIAVFILLFIFHNVQVDGNSMLPTLHNNERLVTSPLFYNIQKDDIVVINRDYDEPLVKRVIATEGQTVNIDFKKSEVYVDGELQNEPFILEPTKNSGGDRGITYPATVPKGCIFVMGDNRNDSLDSRYQEVGMIHTDHVFGKVLFRLTPFNKMGLVK